MKLIFSTIFVLNFCLLSFGQAPESFSYQAVVRDASGAILPNDNVNLKIMILDNSANGTVLYSETHNVITNEYGLINLQIGEGTILTGVFSSINWGVNNKFVRMEMDPTGGSSFTFLGTSQLLSVPYALYAESSGNSGTTYSAGNGISISGNIIANSAPDQTVTLTGAGSTTVNGTYPNFTVTSIDNVNDADSNPTNELQTLSQTGTNVTLSNGGGTISVNDGDTSLWKINPLGNIYRKSGLVGIGLNAPLYRLHINDTLSDLRPNSLVSVSQGGTTAGNIYRGFSSQLFGTDGYNRSIQAASGGISTGDNIAFAGFSDNALNNYGIVSVSGNVSSTSGSNIGVYSLTNGSSSFNTGIFSEIGENTNGASNNGIVSYILGNNSSSNIGMYSSVNNSLITNIAISGDIGSASTINSPNSASANSSTSTAVKASNQGTGGTTTYGVNAFSMGGSSTNFGVYGYASGNPPTNSYSIYGQEGSTNLVNYAGYFNGKVTITGTLSNPSDRRLKTNIRPIESGILDKLKSLSVYNFEYSATGDYSSISLPTGQHIGLIAQDLETVFPQVVSEQYSPIADTIFYEEHTIKPTSFQMEKTSENSNQETLTKTDKTAYTVAYDRVASYKAVNYIELIPILLQGIKEQQLIIENQQLQIDELNSDLAKMKQQMLEFTDKLNQLTKQ